jgi:uncharacterized protein YqgV (UPF0045/DUF77 family)
MDSLIKISVALALSTLLTGKLPEILKIVKRAQLTLVQESKASRWPKAFRYKIRYDRSY